MRLFFCRLLLVVLPFFSGCAVFSSYQHQMKPVLEQAASGHPQQALQSLEKSFIKDDQHDLLFRMEKGQLERIAASVPASVQTLTQADQAVRKWEFIVQNSLASNLGQAGSYLVNEKTRLYEGTPFEHIMLSTYLALDHFALGDRDTARIYVKATQEREAFIAELQSKKIAEAQDAARSNQAPTRVRDLSGYPLETLEDPSVLALQNGYQSAFSQYLAGFVYESLGESELARPSYRKALELMPDRPLLEKGLAELDLRRRGPRQSKTDVLFVLEQGQIPLRTSLQVPIPFSYMVGRQRIFDLTRVSFPVLSKTAAPSVLSLSVDGASLEANLAANLDLMARRTLRDEMPGLVARSVVRAVSRAALSQTAMKRNDTASQLAGVLVSVAGAIVEQADERSWTTLPAQILIARASLSEGAHQLQIKLGERVYPVQFSVKGSYDVVPLRIYNSSVALQK